MAWHASATIVGLRLTLSFVASLVTAALTCCFLKKWA